MRRRMVLVAGVLLALVALLPLAVTAQDSTAAVRVMHASPDAPAVDVFVDGTLVLAEVPFFALSGALSVPAGAYRIQVAPAGAGPDSAVIDATVEFTGGKAYTIAAVNSLENIEPLVLEDDTGIPPQGQARVRILHAAPDAPAVDIKLAGTDTAVLSNAPFKAAAYLDVPAGSYTFDITPAGSSDVVFTTPPLRFESGWTYTLVATGFLDPDSEGDPGFWVQSRIDQIVQ